MDTKEKLFQLQSILEAKIEEIDNEIKKKKPSSELDIIKSNLDHVKTKDPNTYNIETFREQIPVSAHFGEKELMETKKYGLKILDELIRIENELKKLI